MAEVALSTISVLICIPIAILAVELLSALGRRPMRQTMNSFDAPKRIAVIVPAHNEEDNILPTLIDVKRQIHEFGRLLVVADNCDDNTAKVARAAGAEVCERFDPQRRGKGYALDWGLRYLRHDPPEAVVIIDADCRVGEGAIVLLASAALASGRPAQALYGMKASSHSPRVQEFAWIVANYVRPLGLASFGLPCQLMGTGMAFSWDAINSADVATGSLVEDVKLGLDLAAIGRAPQFCPSACVESTFPSSEAGLITQRRRWEFGSVQMLLTDGPYYLWKALTTCNLHLLVLALDVMVPPITLLAGGVAVLWLVALAAALTGNGPVPLVILTVAGALLAGCLVATWAVFGRQVLQAKDIWQLGRFLAQKFKIHRWRPGQPHPWIRTDRS